MTTSNSDAKERRLPTVSASASHFFGQQEILVIHHLAEIGRLEELLGADDLCARLSQAFDISECFINVCTPVLPAGHLNQADLHFAGHLFSLGFNSRGLRLGHTADRAAVFDQAHHFNADDLPTREMFGDDLEGAIVVFVTVNGYQDHFVCHQVVAVSSIGEGILAPLGHLRGLMNLWLSGKGTSVNGFPASVAVRCSSA